MGCSSVFDSGQNNHINTGFALVVRETQRGSAGGGRTPSKPLHLVQCS